MNANVDIERQRPADAASMLALRFGRLGSLDSLKVETVPRAIPRNGEVLVRIHAAGINPSDIKNVLGLFPYTTLPRTPGRDFAGVVAKGPAGLVGQRVWGTGRDLGFDRDGSHAEYLVLPATGVAPLPAEISFAEAASAGVPYTTALEALDRLEVDTGDRLLVLGSGAVAIAATVLARHRGVEPVLAVRDESQVSALRAHGFRAELAPEAEVLPPGFKAIFDTTGHRLPEAIHALDRFGKIAIIAAPPGGEVAASMLALYRKGGSIIGVNSLLHDSTECTPMLERIAPALKAAPNVRPIEKVNIEHALAAYRAVESGARAKFVLTMSE